ncbi:P-loop containing nucleoside triphosphate hydrolase protein [Suillus lakei]|nr:P-loop containing nucleoside triphosphate hydrolase protein [Suillus lakei]
MQDLYGDSLTIYKVLQDLSYLLARSIPEPFSADNKVRLCPISLRDAGCQKLQVVFQVMSERSLGLSNETWWTNRARSRSVDLVQFDDDLEAKSEVSLLHVMDRSKVSVIEQGRPGTGRNIVIFGETGVGKSSLINLIAGRDIAPTSPDALSCTTEEHAYEVDIRGQRYTLHDTVGLGEGSHGSMPADMAPTKKLKYFLRKMSQEDGLHLLVYCVRGSRATRALRHSYETFSAAIAGMKVPVVLAVTCIDEVSEAGGWWERNGKITSYRDRRYQSKIDVLEKISELCGHDGVRGKRPRRQRSLPFTR